MLRLAEELVDAPLAKQFVVPTLTITLAGDVPFTPSRCGLNDPDVLLDHVAQSRDVLVAGADGSARGGLGRVDGQETENDWISRVLVAVLPHLDDTRVACDLVAAAFERRVAAPIRIECRVDDSVAKQIRPGIRLHALSRPIPLAHVSGGVWVLLDPSGTLDPVREDPELVAGLTECLRRAEARDGVRKSDLRHALTTAASSGDPQAFVNAAANLLDGPVGLKDGAGSLLAVSDGSVVRDCPRELSLQGKAGHVGALLVQPEYDAGGNAQLQLAELATAALAVHASTTECQRLQNRLAVMSYFCEQDMGGSPTDAAVGRAHRLVRIRSDSSSVRTGEMLVTRLLSAAVKMPTLADLTLVTRDGAILGAYSDDGGAPETHQQAWEAILHDVDRTDSLTVVVSATATSTKSTNRQHSTIEQVGHLQRDGGEYFELPSVVVIDQLGPLAGVLRAVPGQQVIPYVRRVLGELINDDRFGGQLIETLYAYLQSGGSPQRAGILLHLHGSTVKYRMRVLRELLGDRLDDPGKRFDLELALRLYLAGRSLTGKHAS